MTNKSGPSFSIERQRRQRSDTFISATQAQSGFYRSFRAISISIGATLEPFGAVRVVAVDRRAI